MKALHLCIAAIFLMALGVAIWIALPAVRKTDGELSRGHDEFFESDRHYDTSGGQEMKPRWTD